MNDFTVEKWEDVIDCFTAWADRIYDELKASDLWAEATKTAQLFAPTSTPTDNKFTRTELAEVYSLLALAGGWARLGSLGQQSRACVRELAHFGKYSVGSYVGSGLLRSSDTYLISLLLGPAALAVYNLPGRFSELIELPLRSFIATATPALSAAFNQHKLPEVARLLRKNAGMLTWAFVPLVLGTLLFADLPIYLLGGAKYRGTEAANLLRLGMVMALLYPIDRFVGVTLDVVNQPRLNLLKVFLMLAVNCLGDVAALLLFHSLYAVALASIPTIVIGFGFGYVQLKKFLPLSLKAILGTGLEEIRALVLRLRLGRKSAGLAAGQEPR